MNLLSSIKNNLFPLSLFLSMVLSYLTYLYIPQSDYLSFTLSQLSQIFISLLKMVLIPLVFVSITLSILKLRSRLFSTTSRTLIYFLLVSLFTTLVTLLISSQFSFYIYQSSVPQEFKSFNILSFIISLIPTNPFKSFYDGNMLQILIISFITGTLILPLPHQSFQASLSIAQQALFTLTKIILLFAPIGVFSLLYPLFSSTILSQYLNLIFLMLSLTVLFILFNSLFLRSLIFRLLPQDIIGSISGGATNYLSPRMLSLSNLGISKSTLSFTLPLLSIIMRQGSCICVPLYTIFVASVFNIPLTPIHYFIILVLTPIILLCAPGIIGGTLMDCAILWSAIGIPLEAVSLLLPIDYFIDLIRTVLNIQGGELVTVLVDRHSK